MVRKEAFLPSTQCLLLSAMFQRHLAATLVPKRHSQCFVFFPDLRGHWMWNHLARFWKHLALCLLFLWLEFSFEKWHDPVTSWYGVCHQQWSSYPARDTSYRQQPSHFTNRSKQLCWSVDVQMHICIDYWGLLWLLVLRLGSEKAKIIELTD